MTKSYLRRLELVCKCFAAVMAVTAIGTNIFAEEMKEEVVGQHAALKLVAKFSKRIPARYPERFNLEDEFIEFVCVHRRYSSDNDLYAFGFVNKQQPGAQIPKRFVLQFPVILRNDALILTYYREDYKDLPTLFRTNAPAFGEILVLQGEDLVWCTPIFQREGRKPLLRRIGRSAEDLFVTSFPANVPQDPHHVLSPQFLLAKVKDHKVVESLLLRITPSTLDLEFEAYDIPLDASGLPKTQGKERQK